MIDPDRIRQLLLQDESPTLEFKSEMFRIFDEDGTVRDRQRDELIKDILSLANGSASTAGEMAYLIIGAENSRAADGTRELHDIRDRLPDAEDLRKMVNAACVPPIERISCETMIVGGKHLFVISIPPGLHLHETTRDLKASKNYLKHIVFVRHNEGIEIASARDREAIAHMKRVRLTETGKVSPVKSWAILGAGLLGWAGAMLDREKHTRDEQVGRTFGGLIVGSVIGGLLGRLYKNFVDIRIDWPMMPTHLKVITVALPVVSVWITSVLNNRFKRRRRPVS
jgi:hypothetical protein